MEKCRSWRGNFLYCSRRELINRVIKLPTIKDEIERLKRNGTLNEHVCVIVWSVEDVLEKAEELKVKISHKEAEEILDKIESEHDATVGISWDTISIYIFDANLLHQEQILKDKEKEKVEFT